MLCEYKGAGGELKRPGRRSNRFGIIMGTLYIDRKDLVIRLDGDAIAFYTSGEREGVVPIKPLKRVVVCSRVLIESAVLNKLAAENVSVLFLSGKSRQFRGILHGRLHNNGLLRRRQYEKFLSAFAVKQAEKIVREKLTAQKNLLEAALKRRADRRKELTKGIRVIDSVSESVKTTNPVSIESLRGFEGGAAAAYFSAYTSLFPESLGFDKRVKRPPADPVNALLSLTYTLLYWEVVREIEIIGLDPTIGFYHDFDYGRESLACDLVEPLRPHADGWVWKLFRERTFTSRDFTTGDEKPGCYLKKNGRRRFYTLYEEWAKEARSQTSETVRALAREILG